MFRSLRLSLLSIGLAGLITAAALLTHALGSFNSLDRNAREVLVAKEVVAEVLPPPMYLIELRLALSRAVEQTISLNEAVKDVDRLEAEYGQRVDYWTANPPLGMERHLLGLQHGAARSLLAAARPEVLDKLRANDIGGARDGLKVIDQLYLAHRAGVDAIVQAGTQVAATSLQSFDSTRSRSMWTLPMATIMLLVVMALCYVKAHRSILLPLRHCVDLAAAVAAGDLTPGAQVNRTDEIGVLQQTLSGMTSQLARLVGEVREGVDAMAATTSQIAQSNNHLSSRTQAQAAALQETAASMEQMTASVKQNADNSGEASRLAASTRRQAEAGGMVVHQAIGAMEEINASSRKIEDIIGVIDGIAFQTNLLALNAAVEAARAGEQGRGFAVVAAEVRNLAQRSATAAKQIKELIHDSVVKIKAGSQLVDESGKTLGGITGAIKKIADLIGEIAAASGEQASGIEQVNDAISQMDATTQQNAALVEEAAAASQLMQDQAQQLALRMGFFRTHEASTRMHAAPPLLEASPVPAAPNPAYLAGIKPRTRINSTRIDSPALQRVRAPGSIAKRAASPHRSS